MILARAISSSYMSKTLFFFRCKCSMMTMVMMIIMKRICFGARCYAETKGMNENDRQW